MAVIYVPWFQKLFVTVPLPIGDLVVSFLMSTVVLWSVELAKWLSRRGKFSH